MNWPIFYAVNWMKNTLLFTYSANILVRLLTVTWRTVLLEKSENVGPHSSNSIENATPSSGTSPLASYKEVHPRPRDIGIDGGSLNSCQ